LRNDPKGRVAMGAVLTDLKQRVTSFIFNQCSLVNAAQLCEAAQQLHLLGDKRDHRGDRDDVLQTRIPLETRPETDEGRIA
jgi:hypothetical protein